MSTKFNVIISGVSVSGDLDTSVQPFILDLGNSDKIGYSNFILQNKNNAYQALTVSGNATCQIDAITNGVVQTVFRGTVEKVENKVSTHHGQISIIHAYDKGIELLNILSPDARTYSGAILSGDQGVSAAQGLDLAIYTSGASIVSGTNLSAFMSQWYGQSGSDLGGSMSGTLLSFKPYVSGYTWKTWYYPDASGGLYANDKNLNYTILPDTFKVKREYAWDNLRKMTRQGYVIDGAGIKVPLEVYIGVSGDIHIFTSGSYEFVVSGTLQYYQTGTSGATLNNIIDATVPYDTTTLKNFIVGWFPAWTKYPLDGDYFTDVAALSGGYISGRAGVVVLNATTSAGTASSNLGRISIINKSNSGNSVEVALFITWSGNPINLQKFNVSGFGPVSANYAIRTIISGFSSPPATFVQRSIAFYDKSGKWITKSGGGTGGTQIASLVFPSTSYSAFDSNWVNAQDIIYTASGTFLSGTGVDGKWFCSGTAGPGNASGFDFSQVESMDIGIAFDGQPGPNGNSGLAEPIIMLDNFYFGFNYQFSPVLASNSGSVGMGYGRRYALFEYPYEVTDKMASGLVSFELNSRMGSKQYGTFTIKDSPISQQQLQLQLRPGRIIAIDAPSLNTGSGQTFYYWKAIQVKHEWSSNRGFYTSLTAVPYYSGTITAPNSNLIEYQLPIQYTDPLPAPPNKRTDFMPTIYPWPRP